MGKRLTPNDAMFLYGESREVMFHVAGLLPFSPPHDAPPDWMRSLMDEVREAPIFPPWNLRLKTPDLLKNPLHSWVEDKIDREYHVRRSALPSPGDERELGILVSRLHGYPVDFHRPPWEMHLIEGLEGGRFAMYVKVHHSLVDGFTAMRILADSLSPDPDERDRPLFFSIPRPPRPPREDEHGGAHLNEILAVVREQYVSTRAAARALFNIGKKELELVTPRQAPKSVLNAKISRSRRFATVLHDIARMKAVAKRVGGTLNDIVLAVSASSLRRYLLELDALPSAPLIAMVPVSVRPKDDQGGGNAVGAILASLATDIADPAERAAAIISSTSKAKQQLQGLSRSAIIQYSAMLLAPSILQMIPGTAGRLKPTFNVVISNVPGPERPRYFRGARLEAAYPMSIPVHGQALNITCNSYAGKVCFGFTGCRDTLPRLQRMAVYCAEALDELEHAVS